MLIRHYYVSIDELMLHNWQQCQSGELRYLRRDMTHIVNEKRSLLRRIFTTSKNEIYTDENDLLAWEEIQKDFIARLGMPQHTKEFATVIAKHTKAIYKYLRADDEHPQKRFFLNDVSHWKNEIDRLLKTDTNTPKNTVEETLLTLSKAEGRQLTTRNTTVLEFHLLINRYSKNG